VAINDPSWASKVYKPTHLGHPCAKWAMASRGNFKWLRDYFRCLEFQWKAIHKSAEYMYTFYHYEEVGWFPKEEQTPFPNCAANARLGINFKHIPDVHEAYKLYINERWKRDTIHLSWTKGEEPLWRMK
jgi:hypothetical protein